MKPFLAEQVWLQFEVTSDIGSYRDLDKHLRMILTNVKNYSLIYCIISSWQGWLSNIEGRLDLLIIYFHTCMAKTGKHGVKPSVIFFLFFHINFNLFINLPVLSTQYFLPYQFQTSYTSTRMFSYTSIFMRKHLIYFHFMNLQQHFCYPNGCSSALCQLTP